MKEFISSTNVALSNSSPKEIIAYISCLKARGLRSYSTKASLMAICFSYGHLNYVTLLLQLKINKEVKQLIQSHIGQARWTKIDDLIWVRQTRMNIFHFIYGKIIDKTPRKITVCYKPISVDLSNINEQQKNNLIRKYYLAPKYYYQSGADTNLRLALMQADEFYSKHHAMEYQESYRDLEEVENHKRTIVHRIKQTLGFPRSKQLA